MYTLPTHKIRPEQKGPTMLWLSKHETTPTRVRVAVLRHFSARTGLVRPRRRHVRTRAEPPPRPQRRQRRQTTQGAARSGCPAARTSGGVSRQRLLRLFPIVIL